MSQLRDYQLRALSEIEALHAAARTDRERRVCLVMPTGSGKTKTSSEWARRRRADLGRGVVFAHRFELVEQFNRALIEVGLTTSIIAPGHEPIPGADVQVASIETVIARGLQLDAKWAIGEEAHHGAADTYRPVLESIPGAYMVGVTATPQRGDGRPLGDIYGSMVVGANYSELLRAGHIVRCRVFRPERYLEGDAAQDAVAAYQAHGEGRRGFAFCRSVKDSKALAESLTAAGYPSANIDGAMAASARARILDRFRAGELRMICNVFVLTEGFDVPDAEVCLLARGASHAGTYLQMVGRVLRPAPGKTSAIFIDLPGASHEHGLPTADREYALEGRAIKTTGESLKNCLACGCTCRSVARTCDECGAPFPRREYKGPKIWNLELMEYFENVGDLETAPKSLKQLEWARLLEVCDGKGFGIGFALQEYEKAFKARPVEAWVKDLGDSWRVRELKRLHKAQMERGWKLGAISRMYADVFGSMPSRALREAAGVPLPSQDAWAR